MACAGRTRQCDPVISTRPRRTEHARPSRSGEPRSGARDGAEDVLVFERSEDGFSLLGGIGRGSGWAGIVHVGPGPDSLVGRAWHGGVPVRHASEQATQIVGPYYSRHAVATPVGQRHVVLFGGDGVRHLRDTEIVRQAAAIVDRTQGVPADKLLADELELVHVLRTLMAYRPMTVRDTLRHVATVAAGALSCEVAVIRTEHRDEAVIEYVADRERAAADESGLGAWLAPTEHDDMPRLEQAAASGTSPFGIEVASHLTLQIGRDPRIGALAVGHAIDRPRGFTELCQRIGRAVAEAAELLITQAMAREQLAAERDLLARFSRTDALTGIANRRAWDEAAADVAGRRAAFSGFVMSCDLDGLKQVNDQFGHTAGDALIRASARLLTSSVRVGDLTARMGGDEFCLLLPDADAAIAARIRARIRRAERLWRVTAHQLVPRLSIGFAPVVNGDVDEARQRADEHMYATKRRRSRSAAGGALHVQQPDRRRAARPA